MSWIQSAFGSKISPIILFIIVILAAIFFISGAVHLLVKFLMKQRNSSSQSNAYPEMSTSGAFRRELQHLFHLHDSGLDQAYIDALPVFPYKDIVGSKEPFDCAVCLCEFSEQDNLRLLPLCSHAFHIDCIDTWLLSNSTCPLCRGVILEPGFSFENPIFTFNDSKDEDGNSGNSSFISVSCGPKTNQEDSRIISDRRVFSVRLGKFKNTNYSQECEKREVGETSNSNIDARRCFSMGSFQYVVADSDLQVALCPPVKGKGGESGNFTTDEDAFDGKKINTKSKGESFSVSKIWLWSKKGKFPGSTGTPCTDCEFAMR
ncbi:RING-H2 finger protein ATL46-like isoform X1 [Olea europaea var. sylvestris]|uniref:RING-type E3 ubiquitin transferase n=1 Tax=Olea europaea subsp. europaea TaxID=158383 RepID=A0A8S0PNH1_OLEEU|nr:RING-H2 finger protein ATL46-like isoform X1 [Olea europaea var. sylvestris]XP_022891528.1 RING-H2 finger protein ATL46-like isoform X1 [Olea europaea var. sylvestris]CAA2954358.1 RING-H2 finger ATL47 [Olea europaea subsp. europaea]